MASNQIPAQLVPLIHRHFSRDELISLCFTLEIRHEDALAGDTLTRQVQNMVEFLQRRSRLQDLSRQLTTHRPEVSWPCLEQISPPDPTVKDAEEGLRALGELTKYKDFKGHIAQYQDEFKEAHHSLEAVRYFKKLHDLFQEIEVNYNLLVNNELLKIQEKQLWSGIKSQMPVLALPINELIKYTEHEAFGFQTQYWLPLLMNGRSYLQAAIQEESFEKLERALLFELHRALNTGLPQVNFSLVSSANALKFDNLIAVMNQIQTQLESGVHDRRQRRKLAAQIEDGAKAFKDLEEELTNHVRNHNDWQRLDDELRHIDAVIGIDSKDLIKTWQYIQETGNELYGDSADYWASELRRSGNDLSQAIAEKQPHLTITQFYHGYRKQVSRHFRKVDDDLLRLCESLLRIASELSIILSLL